MKKYGTVYLVGAGPGDPDLATLKAVDVINTADVIIYDFLASADLLKDVSCEKIYAGKQGKSHTLSQDRINKLIIDKAKEGKNVVRLKGGDPFIFGRGGEEIQELLGENIPFRIIPGISSFYAAATYAGIPVTHRDYAGSFEVITGHRRADGKGNKDINIPDYRENKTFIFIMGMENIEDIAGRLVNEKKFPPEIPTAVVEWGTTPKQKVATSRLDAIAETAKQKGLGPPAVIIVGNVVKLRDEIGWYEKLPLFGRKIIVTRTREQASALSQKLKLLGAEVIEFPTIEIRAVDDLNLLSDAFNEIESFEWIIFTSQNAVSIFFGELKAHNLDCRILYKNKIAAIGPATAAEIEKYTLIPDLVPGEYVAEALLDSMMDYKLKGKRVLLPSAAGARDVLAKGLHGLGADVVRIPLYDAVVPEVTDSDVLLELQSADMVTFTSSSTVRNYFAIVKKSGTKHACIGPVTADTVKEAGYSADVIAEEFTIDGLVEAIVKYFKDSRQ